MEHLLALQQDVPSRSPVARALGVSPLDEERTAWYRGALGEATVGRLLEKLPEGWTVLHAVPVGKGDSDIDQVVIGPGGVFTINTKNHAGQKVWVAGRTLLVSGHPSGAARLLIDVGDITRFPTKGHFASWNGTAPLDASSGDQIRHRLSRAGNRQINRTLHIMATVRLRNPTEGRAYYDRKKASGKTSMEALRCLSAGCPTSSTGAWPTTPSTPSRAREDTRERLRSPARPAHIPAPALRTSHFPDPPTASLKPTSQPRLDTEGSHEQMFRGVRGGWLGGPPIGHRPARARCTCRTLGLVRIRSPTATVGTSSSPPL